MNELKFNSQICTTKEQSQRLLDLGLKPETADCFHWSYSGTNYIGEIDEEGLSVDDVPAWSLHRLIELCGVERMPISFYKKGKVMIRVNHIHPTHTGRSNYNHYDSLIDCIEWLIKEGHFNKEYLKL